MSSRHGTRHDRAAILNGSLFRDLARGNGRSARPGAKLSGTASRRSRLLEAIVACLMALIGCSSSSTISGNAALDCTLNISATNRTSDDCFCIPVGMPGSGVLGSTATENQCNAAMLGTDSICSVQGGQCECAAFDCDMDSLNVVTCGYDLGQLGQGSKRVPPSSCTAAHYCFSLEPDPDCRCQDDPCDPTLEREVDSCTDATAKTALQSPFTSDGVVVSDCRVALGGSSSSPSAPSDDGGGQSAKCTAAGPGTCGDMPDLNHCNCGASCYRDSASVGSGYNCHSVCMTNADCQGLYSFPTTCQPFTADTGTMLMECRM
jgi:hypothetical protein